MSVIGSIFGCNVPAVTTIDNTGAAYNAPIQRHPGSIQGTPAYVDGLPASSTVPGNEVIIRVLKAKNGRILCVSHHPGATGRLWVVPDGEDLAKYVAAAIAEQAMSE